MKTLNKDVVILGGGSAGMNAFRAARKHTDSVLLIEDHHFGTTCARVGCMPSKLLIAAAEARHAAMHTDPFGVHISGEITVNGKEVMQRVKSERDRFVGFVMEDVEGFPAECRMLGRARFIDEHTVQVDDDTQITFKRAVIATGSRSIIIPAWQALGDKLIVNDDVFSWDTLPESVAVFGPGVIGLELGQALHRLGVRVSVFGIGGLIGGITDPVITEKAKAIFSQELDLYLDAKTQVQLTENQQVQVTFEDSDGRSGTATYDYLLAAIGL
ncbi:MAG: FAD-dependent oxidoreductase, partial [Neisseriaceae bacterium]|nr:FAD-dependent oxidoreductase [Neisseriaceae bacterium]